MVVAEFTEYQCEDDTQHCSQNDVNQARQLDMRYTKHYTDYR